MLKARVLLFSLLMLMLFSANVFSQDSWQPPKPLEVKVFDALVGEWEGVNEMMGMKTNEYVKIYWTLNKQFLAMEIRSVGVDKPDIKYNGLAYYSVDKSGAVKGWWFDDWGTEMTMTGTGTIGGDNKFTVVSTNAMIKDDRTVEVNGSEIVMTSTTIWTENGQEMKMDSKTIFKKK